jgi:hypothetical protein
MLLGGAAGIRVAQSLWQLLDLGGGAVSVAVPVGGVVGAVAGGLLGLISNPRLLVLLMAVFAGSAAGAVAGKVAWGDVGEIGGQVAGALFGGGAWRPGCSSAAARTGGCESVCRRRRRSRALNTFVRSRASSRRLPPSRPPPGSSCGRQ